MSAEIPLRGMAVIKTPSSDWQDFTEEDGVPTICRAGEIGVGALQFTIAHYRRGQEPRPSDADLVDMARAFGRKQIVGQALDESMFSVGPLRWATASYRQRDKDAFWRVWYGSDGLNFAIITYVCDWARREDEAADVDEMIKSFRFIDQPQSAAA